MSRTEPSVYWVFTVWFFFTDLSNLSGRWCGWALVGSSLSTGAVCGLGSIIEGGRGWALDAGHLIEDDQIEIDETSIQVSNRSMKSEFQNSIGNRSVAEAHPTAYSPGEMRCNTSTPLSLSLFIYLSIYLSLIWTEMFHLGLPLANWNLSSGRWPTLIRRKSTRERERERERERKEKKQKKRSRGPTWGMQ